VSLTGSNWKNAAGCALSLFLAGAAFAMSLKPFHSRHSGIRLIMVCVPGLSWADVRFMERDESCSAIRSLMSSRACWAGLRWTAETAEGVLATLLTGRFQSSHGATTGKDLECFDGAADPVQRVIWDVLAENGRPVVAVGWPLWYPLPAARAVIVPVTSLEQDAQACAGAERGRGSESGEVSSPSFLTEIECRCARLDRLAVRAAMHAAERFGRPDIFVCLPGLEKWRSAERGQIPPDKAAAESCFLLLRDVDRAIGALLAAADPEKTLFVLMSAPARRSAGFGMRPADERCISDQAGPGVLLAAGPDVRVGAADSVVRDVDVAPMIIYRLGLRVPLDADGSPWNLLFGEKHGIQKSVLFAE